MIGFELGWFLCNGYGSAFRHANWGLASGLHTTGLCCLLYLWHDSACKSAIDLISSRPKIPPTKVTCCSFSPPPPLYACTLLVSLLFLQLSLGGRAFRQPIAYLRYRFLHVHCMQKYSELRLTVDKTSLHCLGSTALLWGAVLGCFGACKAMEQCSATSTKLLAPSPGLPSEHSTNLSLQCSSCCLCAKGETPSNNH